MLYKQFRKFVKSKGFTATHCHNGSGEEILRLPNDLNLMIMVEIYDSRDGYHRTVPLDSLSETIAEMRPCEAEHYDKYETTDNPDYMFADFQTYEGNVLKLECPDTLGGNLGTGRGCRTNSQLLIDPNFKPVAVVFFIGSVGSYKRGLYYYHNFETGQDGCYVRDVTASGKPREYSRRRDAPDRYDSRIFLIPVSIKDFRWKMPRIF